MEHKDGLAAVKRLYERASCRTFSSEPVTDEQLDAILEAALHAASGGNLQPWSVIVERSKDRNRQLAEVNGGQKFMEQAPVNLIFLLDWYRMSVYAARKKAPFQCHKVYMHFLIGLEDVICAAQTAETAAHLLGLGSCYVGTCNSAGSVLAELYNLPQKTYPVVILSLGHPKQKLTPARKLSREIMVFEGRYPDLSEEEIFAAYEKKYGDMRTAVPKSIPYRQQMMDQYKKALATSYGPDQAREIAVDAEKSGFINEIQRRFGLHYHAADAYKSGGEILKMMADQGLSPFDVLLP